jgi:hypothetical protein
MTINRDNFEIYMLDYLEGNLDPLLTADLMAFFAENPGFEKLLLEFDQEMVLKDSVTFENKTVLKKDFSDVVAINAANFEEFCIASCENILGYSGEQKLADYLAQHPHKQADYEMYRKLKLHPDTSVVYPGKASLKKSVPLNRSVKLKYLYYSAGLAAASLALFVMLTVKKQPAAMNATAETKIHKETPADMNRSAVSQSPATAKNRTKQPVAQEIRHHQQITGRIHSIEKGPSEPVHEVLNLAFLSPISGTPLHVAEYTHHDLESVAFNSRTQFDSDPSGKTSSPKPESSTEGFLNSLLAKVDFWETAEIAVQGFNYLTESQLSIGKETDAKGNMKGLLLDTESYAVRVTK